VTASAAPGGGLRCPLQENKKTGVIVANAATTCSPRTATACLSDRDSHLIAKNTRGNADSS
jgi:hypothetical protein